MKNKYIRTLLLATTLLLSAASVLASPTHKVSITSITMEYPDARTFKATIGLGENINWIDEKGWQKFSVDDLLKNHGKFTEGEIFFADGNWTLVIEAFYLTPDSKMSLSWDDLNPYGFKALVSYRYVFPRSGVYHEVNLIRSSSVVTAWNNAAKSVLVEETARWQAELDKIEAKKLIVDQKLAIVEEAIPDNQGFEAKLNSARQSNYALEAEIKTAERLLYDPSTSKAKLGKYAALYVQYTVKLADLLTAHEDALRAESIRKQSNGNKLGKVRIHMLEAERLLLAAQNAFTPASTSRKASDIATATDSATRTKNKAVQAQALATSIAVKDGDTYKLEVIEIRERAVAIIAAADTLLSNILNIPPLTEEEKRVLKENEAWNAQVIATLASETLASASVSEATEAMASSIKFHLKLEAINTAEEVKENFSKEITKLEALKRAGSNEVLDSSKITTFRSKKTQLDAAITKLREDHSTAYAARRNTITTQVITTPAQGTPDIKASYRQDNNAGNPYIEIISEDIGVLGNGKVLKFVRTEGIQDCKKVVSDIPTISCAPNVSRHTLSAHITGLFEGFKAYPLVSHRNNTGTIESSLPDELTWTLSGGVDGLPTIYHEVTFAPSLADSLKTYKISIKGFNYSVPVHSETSIKEIVESLYTKISFNPHVACIEDDKKITCKAKYEDEEFSYSTEVLEGTRETINERLWRLQVGIVRTALRATEVAQGEAISAINSSAALSDKGNALEALKFASLQVLSQIEELKKLKSEDFHTLIITRFETAHNAIKLKIADLENLYNAAKVAAEREYIETALTGYWKFPVIVGLNYEAGDYSSITGASGSFKCKEGELVSFSIKDLALTSLLCTLKGSTKTTDNIALNTSSLEGFKVWGDDEEGNQARITKVLFGLFNKSIQIAFAQEDKNLNVVTIALTPEQESRTAGKGLDANDLALLVQEILGTSKPVVLPKDEQVEYMLLSGWKKSEVFSQAVGITSQERKVEENSPVGTNVGDVLDITGTVINFEITGGNAAGLFKIDSVTGQIQVARAEIDFETSKYHVLTVAITLSDNRIVAAFINIKIKDLEESVLESKKSSGGGCVYNPNAKGASSIGVIFFLVLSMYYIVRRKRLFKA